MNIYAGNLPHELTEEELKQAFEAFGAVDKATIIRDRFSDQSRGFGFVEMPSAEEAKKAIEGLNEKDLKGRTIRVNEARPKPDRRGGGRRY